MLLNGCKETRQMHSLELSIIMPAYLEAANLKELLPRVNKALNELNVKYEIIIVDTIIPMDNSMSICKDNGAYYINREGGNNYGDAIRTGIECARGRYLIFMDADGSHSPEFIKQLYNSKEGFDVVVASRYVEGGNTENNRLSIILSKIVNIVYSKFLHLDCHDVSNSFKLYNMDLLKEVKLVSNNFDIIEEILIKLRNKKKNLKINEIPFSFKKRMFGTTKRNLFLFSFSYIFTLIKLKFMK